jgi:hypothetical protein
LTVKAGYGIVRTTAVRAILGSLRSGTRKESIFPKSRSTSTVFIAGKTNMNKQLLHSRITFGSVGMLALIIALISPSFAPISQAQLSDAVVPTLVSFNGTLTDPNGKPMSGMHAVTFSLYKDQQGGAPLWMEVQNATADKYGHYTVALGSTTSQGLPTDLFSSGEARWLAVQPEGQEEQPRVLLLSVPYALKAGDSQTLGGLPVSAFALANSSMPAKAGADASHQRLQSRRHPPRIRPSPAKERWTSSPCGIRPATLSTRFCSKRVR